MTAHLEAWSPPVTPRDSFQLDEPSEALRLVEAVEQNTYRKIPEVQSLWAKLWLGCLAVASAVIMVGAGLVLYRLLARVLWGV